MRTFLTALFLATILPATSYAADCKLQLADSIQMFRMGSQWLVPITLNGSQEYFLFDTGGYYTQISRSAAQTLKLPVRQGNFQLFDVTGNISRDEASVHDLALGRRHGADVQFPISPNGGGQDGILALDQLVKLDTDLDFSTDKLNFFFQDHCPGQVVYWTSPANASAIPISMEGYHITVPVTLDGHEEKAIIDTGAVRTALNQTEEERLFHLTLGDSDSPQDGVLNGDTSLKVYKHTFQTLKFGDVSLANPTVDIIPNAMGRNADRSPLVSSRTKSEKDLLKVPDLIIGMDVLQNLHIYLAFGENKMYVSPVPLATPEMRAQQQAALPRTLLQGAYAHYASAKLKDDETKISASPDDAELLNDHCWMLASTKSDLDAALADCDKAIKLSPGNTHVLDSRGLVLYQQGKFQDALDVYNQVLAADPKLAPSLLMRGYAKGKLGDQAGHDADIAAAKTLVPNIETQFRAFNLDY